jgi:GntR family transcriptional regulator/MocR family aminotransferase
MNVTARLDPLSHAALYRQLYDRLRQAILEGTLVAGSKMPSTRALALELGIARNTVLGAYQQLRAEGYLAGRLGSGTYVSRAVPEELLHAASHIVRARNASGPRPVLSRRALALADLPGLTDRRPDDACAFRHGLPAVDAFPFDLWARLTARRWRSRPSRLLGYDDPAGYRPLREAIAGYLGTARGVRCKPDQVIVVAGSQQGIDLVARVLLDPDDSAWIEDPGYVGARGALKGAGIRLAPVPVDNEGIDVKAGAARAGRARLVYVTPAHQYPLGVTMSIGRRLALLDWAHEAEAWILEDDYDSEYRYVGRPLAALQSIDSHGRVIYMGTFSKVLFPSLRLGYLVVPPALVDAFVCAKAATDRHSATIVQAVVADFIAEGHFTRHIRRMRLLYAERQEVLVRAAAQAWSGFIDLAPADSGMHLIGWLAPGVDDQGLARQAAAQGIVITPLSRLALKRPKRGGMLIGYAAIRPTEIREAVRRLPRVCDHI